MSRKLKLIACTSAIMLLVGGCDKKVGGQVVAIVNGEEISQSDLNAELQGATIPPDADNKLIMAQVLQRVIDRKLLVQKAKADGIDKSPAYLEQKLRGDETLAVNLLTSKVAKGIALPDASAVGTFISTNPSLFDGRKSYAVDQLAFPVPSNIAILRQLEPAHSLDAVAAILTAANIQFQRSKGKLDTAMVSPAVSQQIAALPAGEPFIMPENGQIVARVITSAEPTPTPPSQSKPAAVELLRRQALASAMQKQLSAARAAAKIDYQPGFAPPKPKTAATTK